MPSNRGARLATIVLATAAGLTGLGGAVVHADPGATQGPSLDDSLVAVLAAHGFTGTAEASLERRLGRPVDPRLAELGRLLFFDRVLALHEDNPCAGCHSPAFGFGDSQTMAIGVQNNGMVGHARLGPRNQRRAPTIVNAALLPRLMLNGRIVAPSGDPFDNSLGFTFPAPEGDGLKFRPGDPRFPTLLSAQALLPFTSLFEMAGFTGAATRPFFKDQPELHQFDDGLGVRVPNDTNHTGFRDPGFLNEEIRDVVLKRLRLIGPYLLGFAAVFNGGRVPGFEIEDWMLGRALAEFATSLTLADAPVDRFARGERSAMTDQQKRGALLFFGPAGCVQCHAVAGRSNEMFSDLDVHALGVPQVAPRFGAGAGNVIFDGPGRDEDFGAEQATGRSEDRYRFRSTPLRNVAVQRGFFHNGSFTRLDDAIRHHLDVAASLATYDPLWAGLDLDLTHRGPDVPFERMDPLVRQPIVLTPNEFDDLLAFVRDGLLDPRARPDYLCRLVPGAVPSGFPVPVFQGC